MKRVLMVYLVHVVATIIIVAIENLLAHVTTFILTEQVAFLMIAYSIVSIVVAIVLCAYESVYLETEKDKRKNAEEK
jgi:hypothetical protein